MEVHQNARLTLHRRELLHLDVTKLGPITRIAELPRWLHSYNWHQRHVSLAGQPPIARLGRYRNSLLKLHI